MPLRKTRYRREPVTEINMTNLIDIIMVLLVVFILISNFVQTSLNIDLPKVQYTEQAGKQRIVIALSAAGDITLNGETVTMESLPSRLQSLQEERPDESLYIHPDGSAVVQDLASIFSIARQAGFQNVSIATDQKAQ